MKFRYRDTESTAALDLARLENAKQRNGKTTAACPACRAAGGDKTGNHLVIFANGKFGCCACPDDPEHRKLIFELVGTREEKPQVGAYGPFRAQPIPTPQQTNKTIPRGNFVSKSRYTEETDIPPPPEVIEHRTLGKPDRLWNYRNSAGQVVGVICRWDLDTGKVVRPFAWNAGRWDWAAMPEPRPLFQLPRILGEPDLPIVLVEGEPAATAAAEIFKGAIAVTWAGGSGAHGKTDWQPLAGRTALFWPDADEPGRRAMAAIAEQLKALGAKVATLNTTGLPVGWDAHDALAEGFDERAALTLLEPAPPDLCRRCLAMGVIAPPTGPTCRHNTDWIWPGGPDYCSDNELSIEEL